MNEKTLVTENSRRLKKIGAAFITALLIVMVSLQCSLASAASVKAPTMKSVKANSSTSVTVKWKKVSKVKGYVIYQKTGSGKYKKIATVSGGSKVSYTKKKLKAATKYSYKVKTYKTINGEKVYSGYSKVKSIYTKPATPTSVKAKAKSETSIKVSWKKVSKAKGYVVYRKDGSKYKKIATISSGNTTSYTINNLKIGNEYTFAVKSYFTPEEEKIYSTMSKAKSATTLYLVDNEPTNNSPGVMVWIPTKGGTKYHNNAGCSNMIDPQEVTESEAVDLGFGPCGRCY